MLISFIVSVIILVIGIVSTARGIQRNDDSLIITGVMVVPLGMFSTVIAGLVCISVYGI